MSFNIPLPTWGTGGWRTAWLLLGLLWQATAYGQTGAVAPPPVGACPLALTVRVADHETGQPLPGATVRVLETGTVAVADAAGNCRLPACPGQYRIEVRLVGYRPETGRVQLRAGTPQRLALTLRAVAQELGDVQVQGWSEATTLRESAQAVVVLDVRPYYGQAFGLTELVNRVPGVRIRQDGGLGSNANLSLNGLGGKQVRVFLDGIPLEFYGRGLGLNVLPVSLLERVDVYRGVTPVSLGAWGAVIRRVPAALVAGHRLTLSAWVRTDSLLPEGIALFCQTSKVHWEELQDVRSDTLRGTTGWHRLTLSTRVSPEALDVLVGCRAGGWGRAWVDDVQLTIDGKPFDPAALPPAPVPTRAEVAWLRGAAHPLRTTDPAAPDTADLVAFGRLLGPARIIALGEASHGTHESMATKARLIRYLVAHHRLEVVILEASLPDAEYLNRYVLTGEGTALEGLRQVRFWSLGNQDVLDLVEWLRRYNQTAQRPVQVVGCDMQDLEGAMARLRDFARQYDAPFTAELARGLATLSRFNAVYNEEFYATCAKAPALCDSSLNYSRAWLAHSQALRPGPRYDQKPDELDFVGLAPRHL